MTTRFDEEEEGGGGGEWYRGNEFCPLLSELELRSLEQSVFCSFGSESINFYIEAALKLKKMFLQIFMVHLMVSSFWVTQITCSCGPHYFLKRHIFRVAISGISLLNISNSLHTSLRSIKCELAGIDRRQKLGKEMSVKSPLGVVVFM